MVTTPEEERLTAMTRLRERIYGPEADPAAVAEYERLVEAQEQDAAALANGATTAGATAVGRAASILRPTRAFVVLLIGVLLVGVAAGAAVSGFARASAPKSTEPPGQLLALTAPGSRSAHATLAIFRRAQSAADRPQGQFGETLIRGTARLLTSEPTTGTQVFAIRDVDGEVCLLAVRIVSTAACTTPATFAASGLEVHWSEVVPKLKANGHVQVDVVWDPAGDVHVQAQR